jgi:hypothetical protein
MSEWSTEKKVDIICQLWEHKRLKELEEQRAREAALAANKKDITEPAKPAAPEAKAEAKASESPVKRLLNKLHIKF